MSIDSTSGTPKPSCSLIETKTPRGRVAGQQLVVRHVAEEDHLRGREALLVGEGLQGVEVGAPARQLADQDAGARRATRSASSSSRAGSRSSGRLFGASRPTKSRLVRPSSSMPAQHRARRLAVAVEVEVDRQDAGAREPEGLELEPVELAVGEAEVHVRRPGCRAPRGRPGRCGPCSVVPAGEVLGRRDVVVEQHAPARGARERPR